MKRRPVLKRHCGYLLSGRESRYPEEIRDPVWPPHVRMTERQRPEQELARLERIEDTTGRTLLQAELIRVNRVNLVLRDLGLEIAKALNCWRRPK